MKELKNPELRVKFNVGDVVVVPKSVAQALQPGHGKQLARVISVGPLDVIHHGRRQQRFGVQLRCCFGSVAVFEEWQLERLHHATPDQLTPARRDVTPWLA